MSNLWEKRGICCGKVTLIIDSSKGKIMWCLSFFATIWAIWKERNQRCFEGKSSSSADVVARARFSVASWVSILLAFTLCLLILFCLSGGRWRSPNMAVCCGSFLSLAEAAVWGSL